eukprot:GDKI01039454.1.p1 GENE.GDKI01039454.1~~GDKI01039454.1.p1  ORF type:complete len:158 (+),score=40.44 GDKI01039454.1:173-646(+)
MQCERRNSGTRETWKPSLREHTSKQKSTKDTHTHTSGGGEGCVEDGGKTDTCTEGKHKGEKTDTTQHDAYTNTHIFATHLQDPARFRVVGGDECVRHLTPREILNIHGFPAAFSFPPSLSNKQCWQLIGNSISVDVISELLLWLFTKHQHTLKTHNA